MISIFTPIINAGGALDRDPESNLYIIVKWSYKRRNMRFLLNYKQLYYSTMIINKYYEPLCTVNITTYPYTPDEDFPDDWAK